MIRHPTMAHLTANTSSVLLRFLRRPATQCAFKSTSTSTAVPDLDIDALATAQASAGDQPALQYDPEHELREQQIERSRNKSRLLPQHRNMLNERVPYAEPQSWIHTTVKYARMQFGRHGTASGIDARVCFATATEQATRDEWERVAFPDTLPTMIERSRQQRAAKQSAISEREAAIAKKLGKLDQWTAELNARVAKRESDARAARDRKDRLVEEVRRQFGFKVDARDERFKELLAQKEKEDKKRQKEVKKKQKDERMLAKLQEVQVATGGEKPTAAV